MRSSGGKVDGAGDMCAAHSGGDGIDDAGNGYELSSSVSEGCEVRPSGVEVDGAGDMCTARSGGGDVDDTGDL